MDPVDINYVAYNIRENRQNPLEEFIEEVFKHHFRLDKIAFTNLLDLLELERNTLRSNPLPPVLKLSVTLRFFATGTYQYIYEELLFYSRACFASHYRTNEKNL